MATPRNRGQTNLPFDLSRLAFHWGESKSDQFRRGFSLAFWQWTDKQGQRRENKYRPRLAIKSIDSKRALKGFSSTIDTDWIDRIAVAGEGPPGAYSHRGHLLDLRTLTFALPMRVTRSRQPAEPGRSNRGRRRRRDTESSRPTTSATTVATFEPPPGCLRSCSPSTTGTRSICSRPRPTRLPRSERPTSDPSA
jgi:hypothetical protein